MRRRFVLFVIAGLALQGCSSKEASPKAGSASGKDPGSAKPAPAHVVELPAVATAVAQAVSSKTYVVLKRDGALLLGTAPEEISPEQGLALADLAGTPVQLSELSAKLDELHAAFRAKALADLPPPEEEVDEDGGTPPTLDEEPGIPMALDEGKMSRTDRQLAREKALEQAKIAGILGSTARSAPCRDDDPFGDLSGGFGYGGFGPGGGGEGWGTIGTGGSSSLRSPAGLRSRSMVGDAQCAALVPLVLADAGAPAARLIELLSSVPEARVAVSTDGGAHAHALASSFMSLVSNAPAGDDLEISFTLRPDGVKGASYRGANSDDVWLWSGVPAAIAEGYAAARQVDALRDLRTARIRIDGDLTVGGLIAAISTLVEAGATWVDLGEPSSFTTPRGGMRGHAAAVPLVRLGVPSGSGDLDKATIRRYIKRNLNKISYCYEKRLLAKPGIGGDVTVQFVIKPNGTVKEVTAKGFDAEVASCIAGVIENITFPKPKGRGAVIVTSYPFMFKPPGG